MVRSPSSHSQVILSSPSGYPQVTHNLSPGTLGHHKVTLRSPMSTSGHSHVTPWSPLCPTEVPLWSFLGHLQVALRLPSGHQRSPSGPSLITLSSRSGHPQVTRRSPSGPPQVTFMSPSSHPQITDRRSHT